ncbi:MAG: ROK family protein [Lachnospiraceae bacterium]|nr:ROK family protein [Lachnospiraceae bacterium]
MGEKRIGVDLGGTRTKIGVVEDGKILEEIVVDTPVSEGYAAVLQKIAEGAGMLLRHYPEITKAGMGVPGLIDTKEGIVCYSNNFGWENVPFVADMQKYLPLKIKIANDAQCAALGEALYGAGKEYGRVALFTLGTGVGGGFVKDGRIETDRYGSMAYIFGHAVVDARGRFCNCGRQGCLEAYASAGAVARMSEGLFEKDQSAKDIFTAAKKNDTRACHIVEEFLQYISIGAVNIANILRPEIIVIGGGVSASADMILPRIEAELKKGVYGYAYAPVKTACAGLQNQAGMVGAANL